jgi:hypothetical protein
MTNGKSLPLIAVILRDYARDHNLPNQAELARHFNFRPSTVGYWWNGEAVPRGKKERRILFEATRHPIFKGPFTKEVRDKALRSAELLPEKDKVVDRLIRLLPVALDDMETIVRRSDSNSRVIIRQTLGEEVLNRFLNASRALVNETSWQKLVDEGAFDQQEGVRHEKRK